jgi:hypothetical protein
MVLRGMLLGAHCAGWLVSLAYFRVVSVALAVVTVCGRGPGEVCVDATHAVANSE